MSRELNINEKIKIFLKLIFSELFESDTYKIVYFHMSDKLGGDMEKHIEEQPEKFYEILKSKYLSEEIIIQMDNVISKLLNDKYGIKADKGVFKLLENGKINDFLKIVDRFLEKKRVMA